MTDRVVSGHISIICLQIRSISFSCIVLTLHRSLSTTMLSPGLGRFSERAPLPTGRSPISRPSASVGQDLDRAVALRGRGSSGSVAGAITRGSALGIDSRCRVRLLAQYQPARIDTHFMGRRPRSPARSAASRRPCGALHHDALRSLRAGWRVR